MNTLLLEFSVVALGVLLLLVDAFNDRTNKNYISYFGALGLAGVLALSFLPQINPLADGPTAAFISIDPGSTFFVRFLLIATIIVVLMTPSFVPVLERYVPAAVSYTHLKPEPLGIPESAEFNTEYDLVTSSGDGASHKHLVVAHPVEIPRVNQVDPGIKGRLDCRLSFRIILSATMRVDIGDTHRTKADFGDDRTIHTEGMSLHGSVSVILQGVTLQGRRSY